MGQDAGVRAPQYDRTRTVRPRAWLLLFATIAVVAACGTGRESTASTTQAASGPRASISSSPSAGDFTGLVDIGHGRKLFVQCRGVGSPTVVLIAGKGNGASDWSQVLDLTDPVRKSQFDEVSSGQGTLLESDSAVLPSVAGFTRVCAYDRPDTRLTGADRSTPRPQPHTVNLDVGDLRAALDAMHETGPYVFVAHSYGGFIAELDARTHPSDVAGLVMVDAASSRLRDAVSPAKLAVFDRTNRMTSPQSPEGVEVLDALAQLEAAPPMPAVPAVVLSADKPYRTDLAPGGSVDTSVTFADWLRGQDLLARYLNATHISTTDSGHNIYLYSPQLVVDAVRGVVDEIRAQNPKPSR